MANESIVKHTFSIAFAYPLQCIAAILVSLLLVPLCKAFFNVYLHSLRNYPGPKLWAATPLVWIYYRVTGQLVWKSLELHRKYGSTVRVAPDQLSYTTDTAWQTIYGSRSVEMPKNNQAGFSKPGLKDVHGILSADKSNHTRLRRVLAPGMISENAVKQWEPHVAKYVNRLMEKLAQRSVEGPVDVMSYFQWTTLDLIVDLLCGEPPECLETESGGEWLKILTSSIQGQVKFQALETLGLVKWRQYILSKPTANAPIDNFKTVSAKVDRRNDRVSEEHNDILRYMEQHNNEKGMSPMEIRLNFATIIGAGTGTTTTWLSSTIHSLASNPHAYRTLAMELECNFTDESEITYEKASQLRYLAAVMQESLRIHSPSPSSAARFVPPGGEFIDGSFVPAGTTVGVHQHAAYHLESNFHRPDEFCPERWLPESREESSPFRNDNLRVLNPFSTGPRTCLGIKITNLETCLILAKFVWNFDFELLPEYSGWLDEQKGTVAWHRTPLMCHLTKREN